jgi:hypothetical protein
MLGMREGFQSFYKITKYFASGILAGEGLGVEVNPPKITPQRAQQSLDSGDAQLILFRYL